MTKQKVASTLFLLWFGHFLVDIMLGIWPIYKTMAQLDLAKAGLIAGLGAAIGEGAQLFFGTLSDRGFRGTLIKFGLVLTCANVLLSYMDNYLFYFFCFFTTCLGSGAFHPSAASLTYEISTERKALFMAIFVSGGALGMAVSQFVFSQTYSYFDGHTVLMAIPSVLLLVWLLLARVDSRQPRKESSASAIEHMKECLGLFRNRSMATLYFSQVSNQTIMWGTIFLLPDLLRSKGYEDWMVFGGGNFALILGAGLMMVPGGWLADRYGAKRVMITSTALAAILFYTFFLSSRLDNLLTLTCLFFMGTLGGLINPLSIALGNKLMPNKSGLVGAYLMGLVWCVAEFLGPGGGGFLTTLFAEGGPEKALMILALAFIPCAFFILRLPEETQTREKFIPA